MSPVGPVVALAETWAFVRLLLDCLFEGLRMRFRISGMILELEGRLLDLLHHDLDSGGI